MLRLRILLCSTVSGNIVEIILNPNRLEIYNSVDMVIPFFVKCIIQLVERKIKTFIQKLKFNIWVLKERYDATSHERVTFA